ncbi:MAG: polyprenyl synthetase family protein [candidate division NC10 bacterium]|nr:polyprenyl synthetase family protein [candidate division NC10 bacterium]
MPRALQALLFAPVAADLAEVERRLQRAVETRAPRIAEVAAYVLGSGGKRVRPALLLLAHRLCGGTDREAALELAQVAEYMHVATLIHDDIVDNAAKRRGRPSANVTWGSAASVLAGDFLYARAIQMLVAHGDFAVPKAFADATVAMTEAEILELCWERNPDIPYEEYLTIITGKTAALFSAACRGGALAASAPSEQVEALTEFGLNLGIGFQLVDDALDFMAREEVLGKPVGNDVREGKITYPLIHLLQTGPAEVRDVLLKRLGRLPVGDADVEAIRDLVREHRTDEATLAEAERYLLKARTCLTPFADGPARASLTMMVDFVLQRRW